MNVLFVVQADFLSNHVGVRRVILYYIQAVEKSGFCVELASMREGKLRCLRHFWDADGALSLSWSTKVVRRSEYQVVVITNPWLCADGLPDLPDCVGIVYDLVPNLIAAGCLQFSNINSIYSFAFAHDVGYRYLLRNAIRICCISDHTKRDFQEFYGPLPDCVHICTHIPFKLDSSDGVISSSRRVLLVNVLDARKNIDAIGRVLESVAPTLSFEVDIVGKPRSSQPIISEFLNRLNRARIKFNIYQDISNSSLVELYRSAGVLFFPSLYEGLGLPVLEAQQEGLPAITSNQASLPEINLNPDLCFNTDDIFGMGNALSNVLNQSTSTLRGQALRLALQQMLNSQISDLGALGIHSTPSVPVVRFSSAHGSSLADMISWEGSFLDFGSLSYVNRSFTSALESLWGKPVVRVSQIPPSVAGRTDEELLRLARIIQPRTPSNCQVVIRHQWPPNWGPPLQAHLVVIQPWEFGALPIEWVKQADAVREFWVPSRYVRDVYIRSGVPVSKVHIVPNGVDTDRFHPNVDPLPLPTRKTYKFLFVGGTIHRKGVDILLKAFTSIFTAEDDVCLVIKDFGGKGVYAGQTFETEIKAARRRPDLPEIVYLNDELVSSDLPRLYRACDVFVLPYRGEGFGLPVLEAMACGLPVVVTEGGSTDDFALDRLAYRIPADRRSLGSSFADIELVLEGWLLEPDIKALGERMLWLVNNQSEARSLGQKAAEFVRLNWTWNHSALAVSRRLDFLLKMNSSEA